MFGAYKLPAGSIRWTEKVYHNKHIELKNLHKIKLTTGLFSNRLAQMEHEQPQEFLFYEMSRHKYFESNYLFILKVKELLKKDRPLNPSGPGVQLFLRHETGNRLRASLISGLGEKLVEHGFKDMGNVVDGQEGDYTIYQANQLAWDIVGLPGYYTQNGKFKRSQIYHRVFTRPSYTAS